MKYCVYLTSYSGNKLPQFYIGSSSIEKVNNGYHGSVKSKLYMTIYLKELKEHPTLFKTFIISKHNTRQDATVKERVLQVKLNVVKSSMYINMSIAAPNGFAGMNVKGVNNPNYGKTMSQAGRDSISRARSGKCTAFDTISRKNISVLVSDIRFKSGEIYSVLKGKKNPSVSKAFKDTIVVKDCYGNTSRVSTSNEEYLNGTLKHHTTGTKTVYEKATNKRKRISLEEFDETLHNNLKMEIIHVKDKDGNSFMIDKTDSRYISGEVEVFSKGRVTVKDSNGNTFSVSKTDPRYISGELVHHTSGTICAYDKNGESMGRIDSRDCRWITGEIVKLKQARMLRKILL